ncbi:hypothetical protein KC19_VG294000 [Ceratodon purpureus]|uniref:Fe2OG dioxygenase domain-containing protein n=1 Tax=Ceratodon purpureus TaxID=3225 RepID=A0A8T0HVV1_CERPU|nr:hypothetical protein KC19_VG294000 [Ceratodon purpureus]
MNSTGRMNHYHVCSDPDSVLGIPVHSDIQMTSILYQDGAGGLQVLKDDGQWVGIRREESTLVVNISDTFIALTNGILHSSVHQAVLNSKKDRYSKFYFYGIDNTITLTMPLELVTKEHPLKYRPFTVQEHRNYLMENEIPLHGTRSALADRSR